MNFADNKKLSTNSYDIIYYILLARTITFGADLYHDLDPAISKGIFTTVA